ncbi:MAG: methylmalonyl Co-A mutase-associated GTPase MeaB, partial [Flavobacteriaceae bacterium]|nr:methylmalonyl Co-A mutase-associated GTPase MeaB [Bacteroidia bacterium]NNL62061.1 methylmalonyl Co-A mutase-associated GTPase MeaB [Flavobacteriaceae bacterium]
AINKADGNNLKAAKLAKVEFSRALHLYPIKDSNWQPRVVLCSAIENTGIEDIWKIIEDFENEMKTSNYFYTNRNEQNKFWLMQTIEERLKTNFFQNETVKNELKKQLYLIEKNETTPFAAAEYLLNL